MLASPATPTTPPRSTTGPLFGCFYDLGLRDALEGSGRVCDSTLPVGRAFDSHLDNSFSVSADRRKRISKMSEIVRPYGRGHVMDSMRPDSLGEVLNAWGLRTDPPPVGGRRSREELPA